MRKTYCTHLKIRMVLSFIFISVISFSQESKRSLLTEYGPDNSVMANQSSSFLTGLKEKDHSTSGLSVLPPPGNDNFVAGLNPPYVLSPNAGPCVTGTTSQATWQSGETTPSCHTITSTMSVWYSFQATNANMWVSLLVQTGTCYTAFGVYRVTGPSIPGVANLVGCVNYPNSNPTRPQWYKKVSMTGLIVGSWYAIQVTYPNNGLGCGNAGGNFCIAVGVTSSCTTCSSPCGPACTFPTGPPTVPQVTSTCPPSSLAPPMNEMEVRTRCHSFTANYPSMSLQMIILGYSCSVGNVYSFNWSVYNTSCGAALQTGTLANLNITGLTAGQNYVLCYNWTSACDMDTVWPYLWSNSPLPVELMSFEGSRKGNKVHLEWKTASEKNSSHFVVERTTDGEKFIAITKVPAAGNSSHLISYETYDEWPFNGRSFYRLREVDISGDEQFSKLVEVNFVHDQTALTIHPNPTKQNNFQISYMALTSGMAELVVFDVAGRKVYNESFYVSEDEIINRNVSIPDLKEGLYYIRINNGGEFVSQKLIYH